MLFQDVIFYVLAVVSVAAALGVVLLKDIFRAALLLVFVFLAVAGFFVMMNAEFLAVVQVLIYAGAIAILIIFAIMLTRDVQRGNLPNRLQLAAILFPALLLVALIFVAVDTDWNMLPSEETEASEGVLQEEFLRTQALRKNVEWVQVNSISGLPADWEAILTGEVEAATKQADQQRADGDLEGARRFDLEASIANQQIIELKKIEERALDRSRERARERGEDPAEVKVPEIKAHERSGLGDLLINDFVLPFEVASVLLLAAVIGALVLVREREA